MSSNAFKHSGNFGDLIYSLPIVRHFGGGDFYLHLDQINNLSKQYYGVEAPPEHKYRLNIKDYEFIKSFMEAQPYINKFEPMDPRRTEITHNLDRFRNLFVGHPGNYVDCYANTFNLRDTTLQEMLRQTPWLTVPEPKRLEGKTTVVNRTARWTAPVLSDLYNQWRDMGLDKESIFVGLPEEHRAFEQATGWKIDYHPTTTLLELASLIAGADQFIGNQSMALSVAIGLGVEFWCEGRRDLPIERNECYFPHQPKGHYF